jgi:hypothetical protein
MPFKFLLSPLCHFFCYVTQFAATATRKIFFFWDRHHPTAVSRSTNPQNLRITKPYKHSRMAVFSTLILSLTCTWSLIPDHNLHHDSRWLLVPAISIQNLHMHPAAVGVDWWPIWVCILHCTPQLPKFICNSVEEPRVRPDPYSNMILELIQGLLGHLLSGHAIDVQAIRSPLSGHTSYVQSWVWAERGLGVEIGWTELGFVRPRLIKIFKVSLTQILIVPSPFWTNSFVTLHGKVDARLGWNRPCSDTIRKKTISFWWSKQLCRCYN